MKKFLVIICLIFYFVLPAFAVEELPSMTVFVEDNEYGLKDCDGNVVVDPIYRKLIRVGDSTWIARKNGRYGLIDSYGQVLVPIRYRHADRILGKFSKFGNFNNFGLYDEYGNRILEHEYSSIDLLYGKMFLTCYRHKYGVTDFDGNLLIENDYDDIYMPDKNSIRVLYEGNWFELKKYSDADLKNENTKRVSYQDRDFTITRLVTQTGKRSSYYAVSATDYTIKLLSSISPAYEETIDDLMLSHGADTVSIITKPFWIVQFPYVYMKKYIKNVLAPNNGPLSDFKQKLKREI